MTAPRTVRLRLGRSWEDGPGPVALIASLLLHGLVLGALMVAGTRQPKPPDWMSARVRIASELPEPRRRPLPAVEPPKAAARPAPEPAAEEPPTPAIARPEAEALGIGPRRAPPEPPPKPEPKPKPKPKPEPKAPPAVEPGPPAEPQRSLPDEPAESVRTVEAPGAAVRFEGRDIPHDAYLGSVVRRVSGQWLKPRSGLPGRPARVYFEIGRNGRLSGVAVEQSSGVASFDRAALRAVRLAEPLPPLPPAYTHPSLKVHFDFIP